MSHHVEVHQLSTGRGAYLNVLTGQGWVGVWGFAASDIGTVHYFCRNPDGNFALLAFDTEAWAAEWLDEHRNVWPVAIRIDQSTPGAPASREPAVGVGASRPTGDPA